MSKYCGVVLYLLSNVLVMSHARVDQGVSIYSQIYERVCYLSLQIKDYY